MNKTRTIARGIYGLSLLLALVVYMFGGIQFSGDAHTYIHYAWGLAQLRLDPNLFWRTPGYPLVLLLTFAHPDSSVTGILLLQTLLSFLMPILLFKALLPYSRKLAVMAALLLIASLAPYLTQLLVYPDHFHAFLPVLMAYLMVRYLKTGRLRALIGLYMTIGLITFFRPTMVVFLPLPLLLLLVNRRYLRVHLLMLVAIIASQLAFGAFKARFSDESKPNSFNGSQMFVNVYMYSLRYHDVFDLSTGPATAEFRTRLEAYLADRKRAEPVLRHHGHDTDEATFQQLYGQYLKDPKAMVTHMFDKPNMYYFWFLYTFSAQLGREGDPLLKRMSIEAVKREPRILRDIVLENGIGYFWGPAWQWSKAEVPGGRVPERAPLIGIAGGAAPNPGSTTPALRAQLQASYKPATRALLEPLEGVWLPVYLTIVRLALITNIIGGFALVVLCVRGLMRRSRKQLADITLGACLFYSSAAQALPLALLSVPLFRYQLSTLPSLLLSGLFGIYLLKLTLKRA